MTHRAPQDYRRRMRPAVSGPRTRFIVAVIGCLLSVGAPVMILDVPGLTSDVQPAGRSLDDPAGLGITGALPGDGLAETGVPETESPGDGVTGDSSGPGLHEFPAPPDLPDGPLGIPGVVLGAYQSAEQTLAVSRPSCHLSWSVMAGIGRIESGHARDGRVDAAGNTLGPILGPPLDGSPGVAAIADTDRGMLDKDTVWDRAVGPMQFIPTSWRSHDIDGNGDGVGSPHNLYDATLAAGSYLCADGADLADPAQLQAAVFRYNHSAAYVNVVLRWAQAYLSGVVPTPSVPGSVPPGMTGNGGAAILASGGPQAAAAPAAVAQGVLPLPVPPLPALTSSAPLTATTPPTATTPLTPTTAPTTTPLTSTTPLATTTQPATTAQPGATSSTPLPLETTTTTPIEPLSSPPPTSLTTEPPPMRMLPTGP